MAGASLRHARGSGSDQGHRRADDQAPRQHTDDGAVTELLTARLGIPAAVTMTQEQTAESLSEYRRMHRDFGGHGHADVVDGRDPAAAAPAVRGRRSTRRSGARTLAL